MSNYRKFLVAVAGIASAVGVVLADGTIEGGEWGLLASAVVVAVGVFFAKNEPETVTTPAE